MLVLVSLLLVVSLLVGCGQTGKTSETTQGSQNKSTAQDKQDSNRGETEDVKPEERPLITITAVAPADQRQGFWTNEKNVELIRNKFGIEFDIQWIAGDYAEQISTILAAGNYPEYMFQGIGGEKNQEFGEEGHLYAVNDLLDKVPNYRAMFTDEEWAQTILLLAEKHEKIYTFVGKNFDRINDQTFIYRKSALDQLGLDIPETMDEFFEVLRILKEETGVTPLVYDGGSNQYRNIAEKLLAPCFRTRRNFFTDPDDENKTTYGPATDKYKDMLRAGRRLIDEGLLYIYQDQSEVDELFGTGQAYVSFGSANLADELTLLMKDIDPDVEWVWAKLPEAYPGQPVLVDRAEPHTGNGPVITKKTSEEKLDRLLELIDWMCTEEGLIWQNYGIEGESFMYENGKIKWMPHIKHPNNPDGTEDYTNYALPQHSHMIFNTIPPEMTIYEPSPKEQYINMAREAGQFQGRVYWCFDTIEDEIKYHEDTDIFDDLRKEYTVKYLKGELDDSSWDEFVASLYRAGYEETRMLVQEVHDFAMEYMKEMEKKYSTK